MADDLRHSLADELRRAAAETPQRPFIRMRSGQWTYAAFDAATDRLAAGLHAHGVRQGDTVSLMLPNCIELALLWFALAKLGAVTAPVNTAFRGAALADAVDLVASRVAVVHADLLEPWGAVRPGLHAVQRVFVVGTDTPAAGNLPYSLLSGVAPDDTTLPRPVVRFDALCLLLYTSGTTGRSKAVMISHRFVLAQARLFIQGLELRPDDVLYCPYPMFHLDATVLTIAPALLLRGVAALGERFSVSRYWDEVRALQATVFDFMGATITLLWKQPACARDRDHRARLGWGVPLPSFADAFEQRFGCRLVELYGSTEVGCVAFTPLHEPRRHGSCGQPASAVRVRLVDEAGFEVPVGEPGELLVRPEEPSLLTQGYYAMPEATLAAFRDLWFHTGDVLRQDADGYLYFVGRRKDMVRRRGENISCAEVELGIEAHPDVLECAVYGVASELSEEDVMAAVVRRAGSSLAPQALVEHCEQRMARFMVPRYLRFLDALPKTPTDKVEKFRLQAQGAAPGTWDRESGRYLP